MDFPELPIASQSIRYFLNRMRNNFIAHHLPKIQTFALATTPNTLSHRSFKLTQTCANLIKLNHFAFIRSMLNSCFNEA
jgi:hypothetical protein